MLLAVLAIAASAYLPIEPGGAQLVDWQDPQSLPRQYRHHCRFDTASARYYCSEYCGSEHEFFYCSGKSFGCCRVGRGYCDQHLRLRCSPYDPVPFREWRYPPRGRST